MAGAAAEQAPNPRATGVATNGSPRADGREVRSVSSSSGAASADTTARSATRRTTAAVSRAAGNAGVTSGNVSSRSAARTVSVPATSARSATSSAAARSAVTTARSATPQASRNVTGAAMSRAASARATAVFNDLSKIGGGYAACREAYATCMDQFCANANETYRRCFCSDKFTEFRDTEAALDEAKTLLMQFQDNNLNAVDKTAAEVNAMYSATVGELAIKKDTSAAQSALNEISDLLSGKKKASTSSSGGFGSLGVLSFDFSDDLDDIWSGSGGGMFASNNTTDLSALEGVQLYNSASNQCLKVMGDSCDSNAVLSMAKSSYNILITQDCNTYEKKINAQKEAVTQTVREAEKILRTARLEEYRSHNSADVNECLDKVRSALLADTACGANYKRCLDYSGVYISTSTGDPIYSPRLFELQDQIVLNGSSDVLGANPQFNQFLDSKRMFATTALESCRDLADTVWQEFKRAALIEIAQAQDVKIEEVKSSCVSTMAECYDTQTSALKGFDDTTAQASGALSAYAARGMCQDKVAACAALYAGPNDVQCQFDSKGHLTNGANCGLAALVTFVQTVDNVRVAEGCDAALTNYANDLCTPTSGSMKYPWNCRNLSPDALEADLRRRADLYCKDPSTGAIDEAVVGETISRLISSLESEIEVALEDYCESEDIMGVWVDPEDAAGMTKETAFYSGAFGGTTPAASAADTNERGYCIQNTVRYYCLAQDDLTGGNGYAKYDAARNVCNFTTEWYDFQCSRLGGYWENGACYL